MSVPLLSYEPLPERDGDANWSADIQPAGLSSRQEALVRLLFQEEDGAQALIELEALLESKPDTQLIAVVLSSLLMHNNPEVRISAARAFSTVPPEQIDASYTLYTAVQRERSGEAPESDSGTTELLERAARDYSSSNFSRLENVNQRAERSTPYAREQNMKSYPQSDTLPQNNFDWIMVSLNSGEAGIRNTAASILRDAVPSLNENHREAALLGVAAGLKDPDMEEGLAFFKGRLLDSAVRLPQSAQTIMPLIGALFHSENPLIRTDAAIATLVLSQEQEDEMTDIIIASLRDRSSLRETPEPTRPLQEASEARIQFEAEYWAQIGMAMYVEKHFNIHLDTWAIDKTKDEFLKELDDICERFYRSMDELAERTASELSEVYRGSLVRHGGLIMYRLKPENQAKILEELCTISYRAGEHETVRQNAIESIASATIDTSFTVGPLLQIGLQTNQTQRCGR
jgi:hypothetical protein